MGGIYHLYMWVYARLEGRIMEEGKVVSKVIDETREIIEDMMADDSVTMASVKNASDDSVIVLIATNLLIAEKLDKLYTLLDNCMLHSGGDERKMMVREL
jgi:hypothetical protein